MIAMQYGFTLPLDYDMGIIDRRIAERGHLLDGFPGLRFKAYLTARPDQDGRFGPDKVYAPFYLWDDMAGLNAFVCGPGFAALSRDFGRPPVRTWIPWSSAISPDVARARYATRTEAALDPHEDLVARERAERDAAAEAVAAGALAFVSAYCPARWTAMRFALLHEAPESPERGRIAYRVGHLSLGAPRDRS